MLEGEKIVLGKLAEIEQEMASIIMDAMDAAEQRCIDEDLPFDDFTEDEDGSKRGIMYPENCAPEMDHARSLVQEAWEAVKSIG